VTEVNDLIQQFSQMKKLMKNAGKFKKMMMAQPGRAGRAGFPGLPGR